MEKEGIGKIFPISFQNLGKIAEIYIFLLVSNCFGK